MRPKHNSISVWLRSAAAGKGMEKGRRCRRYGTRTFLWQNDANERNKEQSNALDAMQYQLVIIQQTDGGRACRYGLDSAMIADKHLQQLMSHDAYLHKTNCNL